MKIQLRCLPLLFVVLGFNALKAEVPGGIASARVVSLEPNPTGLSVGFWADYTHSGDVARDFGLRPIERVNFHEWKQIEKSPGIYTWNDPFKQEKNAQRAGATVFSAVNLMFNLSLNKQGMAAMPAFYPQDIRDPQTRTAAKKFLAAFVEHQLDNEGPVVLMLDYEFFWFALPRTPEIRQAYRDWFIEAAQVCRDTAAKLGRSQDLVIACNPATDLRGASNLIGSPVKNHQPQQWLKDIVDASDVVTLDIYGQDPANPVADDTLLNEVRFFVENYAKDKPVYITENGYSTDLEGHPAVRHPGHGHGSEAEQAAYYQNVFTAWIHKNDPGNAYLKNLRGYCIWCYSDRKDQTDPEERDFGLVRIDGSHKPGWDAVHKGIAQIEADPGLNPWKQAASRDVTQDLDGSDGVALHYQNGTTHDVLEIELADASRPAGLDLTFNQPVSVVAQLPDGSWRADIARDQTQHHLDLPAGANGNKTVRIMATASKFPVDVRLIGLKLTLGASSTNQ